jgi:RHS repeat-associated protein
MATCNATGTITAYTYELTDHLGNVRATVGKDVAIGTTQLLTATDYFPFGMEMPGRRHNPDNYRFGYQGQFAEKDQETGYNQFELRLYDARIGRFPNPDPYRQYWSSYMAMGNNPVNGLDPDGREVIVDGSFRFKIAVYAAIAWGYLNSADFRKMYDDLDGSPNKHTILQNEGEITKLFEKGNKTLSDSPDIDDTPLGIKTRYLDSNGNEKFHVGTGKGTGSRILWDISAKEGGIDSKGNRERPIKIGLFHEMFHSYDMDRGLLNKNIEVSS